MMTNHPGIGRAAATRSVFAAALLATSLAAAPAFSQEQPQDQEPPAEPWATQCGTEARSAPLDCAMEQHVVDSRSNRVLASVRIRVPDAGAAPVMLVQFPLGVHLPSGLTVNIDGQTAASFPFQSCDQSGCYVGTQVSQELLGQMRGGNTMELAVEGQNRQPVNVPVTLDGFTKAYDRIR